MVAYNKHILLVSFLFSFLFSSGQKVPKYNRYFAKDQLSISVNSAQLLNSKDIVDVSEWSNGLNLHLMYPIIGNKSNVALAAGFGWSYQNYYLNKFINTNSDSVWFTLIPDSLNHKKYKLNTNYFTIPVEIRFRTNPDSESKSYKLYLGFRAGLIINSHTKYVGYDPYTNEKVKEKQYYIKHLQPLDYGLTLRMGKGDFMINAYYSLTHLFNSKDNFEMTPIEVGLTIVLF